MNLRHAWIGALLPFAAWLVLQHPVQQRLLLAASPLLALPYLLLALVRRREWVAHLSAAAACLGLFGLMLWDTGNVDAQARSILAHAQASTPCGPTAAQLRSDDPRWHAGPDATMELRLRGLVAARQRVRYDASLPRMATMEWGYRGMANGGNVFLCRDSDTE